MPRINTPAELNHVREHILSTRDPERPCVTICTGTGCLALGAAEVAAAFKAIIQQQGLPVEVDLRETGCHGFCERGTVVIIHPEEICYLQVQPGDAEEVVNRTVVGKEIVERLLYLDAAGERVEREPEIGFYKQQQRLLIGQNLKIDPRSIDDYLAVGGYSALARTLFELSPEDVLAEVKASGLRGRGGAGFPTGRKWEFTRAAPGETKYVVVNADEGDPGAYMDRSLLEGNPHLVLEGLTIGAHTVGASQGFIYVRQEYSLAVKNIYQAIEQSLERGLLGHDIIGSGFDFSVTVVQGAGAFVCGEETALLKSLEGLAGEPRPRPPYPAVQGLWDNPTNINNVETWANVPLIVNRGAEAFASVGTEGSKGTKIFALVGKINNTGLVEVPMGITLRQIIHDIGGGIPEGKQFKAVQTGGPSGGCIPADMLDLKVDFDELTAAGSMMGSGGMIVMDEDTCMVDITRYFIDFLTEESCGKCLPCREGLRQMHRILTRITKGQGKEEDLDTLHELSEVAKEMSLCGLGQTAANPFFSTFRYFKDEYEAHIKEKRCPALSCKSLINYWIDPARCTACCLCLKRCPDEAIDGGKKRIHVIIQDKCTNCGTCLDVCPDRFHAVTKLSGEPVPPPIPEDRRTYVKKKKAKK